MFNAENIISGGAIGISITGMAIVFCGLVLISLFITALPAVLDIISRIAEGRKEAKAQSSQKHVSVDEDAEDKDLASVIGLVMQMEESHLQSEQDQENIDIANVIGLVLQLEQEQRFAIPN